jgi:hypothetical protein
MGTLEDVRAKLTGWTYRMLVMGMMGTVSMAVIGNPAYNTCANLVIALLGGPESSTRSIAGLDPGSFAAGGVRVGRYMLTARTAANENVASVTALTRLYTMLAHALIPGLSTQQHHELCSHLMKAPLEFSDAAEGEKTSGALFTTHQKDGSLPAAEGWGVAVRSTAGFCHRGGDGTSFSTRVYAINLNVPLDAGDTASAELISDVSRQLFRDFKAVLCGEVAAGLSKL